MLQARDFFELRDHPWRDLFADGDYVWQALPRLSGFISSILHPNAAGFRRGNTLILKTFVFQGDRLIDEGFAIDTSGRRPVVRLGGEVLEGAGIVFAGACLMDDLISLGEGTIVEAGAYIRGPAVIGARTEVRQGAYIRGEVLVGEDCVVGHTTEMKSSIMLGHSKAGHFTYIGDSILGQVNLGAGTKLANLKLDETPVSLRAGGRLHQTGLRKFGAILGDGVQTGCNSVTQPGTLLGRGALLYPNTTAGGYYDPESVIRGRHGRKVRERGEQG